MVKGKVLDSEVKPCPECGTGMKRVQIVNLKAGTYKKGDLIKAKSERMGWVCPKCFKEMK